MPRNSHAARRRPVSRARSTTARGKVPTILLDPQTIRKDNIGETVIADDFASWDDVCVGEYEQYCPEDR